MKCPLLLLLALHLISPNAHGQKQTAIHREVYAEINRDLDHYEKVSHETIVENSEVKVTGYRDHGELRKLLVQTNGDHGSTTEEYYLNNKKLLFAFAVMTTTEIDGTPVSRSEDRYYFKGGRMIKWIPDGGKNADPESPEFAEKSKTVLRDFGEAMKLLGKGNQAAAAGKSVTGKFTGIEQGDYFHWNMESEAGEDLSFFILKGGKTIDKVIEDQDRFIGKTCQVHYTTSLKEIPEAGGTMEISEITDVKWVE